MKYARTCDQIAQLSREFTLPNERVPFYRDL